MSENEVSKKITAIVEDREGEAVVGHVVENTPDEEYVVISREYYESLLEDEAKLIALEDGGVDNWSGYDSAMESLD